MRFTPACGSWRKKNNAIRTQPSGIPRQDRRVLGELCCLATVVKGPGQDLWHETCRRQGAGVFDARKTAGALPGGRLAAMVAGSDGATWRERMRAPTVEPGFATATDSGRWVVAGLLEKKAVPTRARPITSPVRSSGAGRKTKNVTWENKAAADPTWQKTDRARHYRPKVFKGALARGPAWEFAAMRPGRDTAPEAG